MKRISTILAIVLCTIMILGPLSVLKGIILPEEAKEQDVRLHANTGNTTRLITKAPEDLSLEISRILYPSVDDDSKPAGYILVQSEHWQDIMTVLPLARKFNSAILALTDTMPPSIIEYISQAAPIGISELQGTQLLVFNKKPGALDTGLQQLNTLKSTVIVFDNTNKLAEEVNKLPSYNNDTYGFVVSDNAPLFSAPVASWVVNQGGALLLADANGKLYPSSEASLSCGGG